MRVGLAYGAMYTVTATATVWLDGWSAQAVTLTSNVGIELKDGEMLTVSECWRVEQHYRQLAAVKLQHW